MKNPSIKGFEKYMEAMFPFKCIPINIKKLEKEFVQWNKDINYKIYTEQIQKFIKIRNHMVVAPINEFKTEYISGMAKKHQIGYQKNIEWIKSNIIMKDRYEIMIHHKFLMESA